MRNFVIMQYVHSETVRSVGLCGIARNMKEVRKRLEKLCEQKEYTLTVVKTDRKTQWEFEYEHETHAGTFVVLPRSTAQPLKTIYFS